MDFASFLFTIGIVLIFAKMFDVLFEKANLPGVLGEIILGIILGNIILYSFYFGPAVSAWLHNWIQLRGPEPFEGLEPIHYLAKLGIVMLLFIAGLDTNLSS